MRYVIRSAGFTALVAAFTCATALGADAQTPITTADMQTIYPRAIGPAVTGGRIADVEALPHDPSTIYVGAASGGL